MNQYVFSWVKVPSLMYLFVIHPNKNLYPCSLKNSYDKCRTPNKCFDPFLLILIPREFKIPSQPSLGYLRTEQHLFHRSRSPLPHKERGQQSSPTKAHQQLHLPTISYRKGILDCLLICNRQVFDRWQIVRYLWTYLCRKCRREITSK